MLKYVAKAQARTALRVEQGDTAVEYGLMVAGITLAITMPMWLIGHTLVVLFTKVTDLFIW